MNDLKDENKSLDFKTNTYHSHYYNQNDYISRNGVKEFCSYGT